MKNANEALHGYNCTENYYRHSLTGKCFTDGVKAMAEQFQAYWFIDLVLSHQLQAKLKRQPFQTWHLKRLQDCAFMVFATDGNGNIIANQPVPFSDFEADELTLWYEYDVLLLPSEH